MSKNKLIRIEPAEGVLNTYTSSLGNSLYFSLVAATEEIKKDGFKYKKQINCFLTCREQLTEIPRSFLHNKNTLSGDSYRRELVDMTKLRLLMGTKFNNINCSEEEANKEEVKARLFSAKRVINILEEEAGWPKSVISTVKHTKFDSSKEGFWLLTGCEKWIKVPQMLSLICLILRLGYKFGPFEATTIEDVNKIFNNIVKEDQSDNRDRDRDYIAGVRKHIIALMKKYDEVFEGDSKNYYINPESREGGWCGYGGITSLMKDSSGNVPLQNRLKEHILNK